MKALYIAKEESTFEYQEDGSVKDNHTLNPDCFVYTDCKVMSGAGKAVVCAVGASTVIAQKRGLQDIKIDEQKTNLEEKLEKVANQIGKYAIAATVISVITHLIFMCLMVMFSEGKDLFSNDTLLEVLNICIIAVVLLIVAIPEGLPLAVSIAMALSIERMKKDEILIKNLESVQSAAMLHDLCISKTGTVTKGTLHVSKIQIGSMNHVESLDET